MADTSTLLEQLRDVQQPLPPEGVPLWLIIANVSIAIFILALLWYRRQKKTGGWRKQLLKDLRRARQQPPTDAVNIAATLLRQLMLFRGHNIQTLSGDAWLHELDKQFDTQWFTQGQGHVFGDALYQSGVAESQNIPLVLSELESLIKSQPAQHKNKAYAT